MYSRHCQRFLPIAGSCHANKEDIKKLAEQMFQSTFFAEDAKPSTVGISTTADREYCAMQLPLDHHSKMCGRIFSRQLFGIWKFLSKMCKIIE